MNLDKLKINNNNGIEIGNNVSIDGPINNNHSLHILSHAHTDHAKEGEIAESLSNNGTEILMTEPTKELLEYTNLNLRTSSRFQTLKYNQENNYGILSGRKIEDLIHNTRLLDGQSDKKNPQDFAL